MKNSTFGVLQPFLIAGVYPQFRARSLPLLVHCMCKSSHFSFMILETTVHTSQDCFRLPHLRDVSLFTIVLNIFFATPFTVRKNTYIKNYFHICNHGHQNALLGRFNSTRNWQYIGYHNSYIGLIVFKHSYKGWYTHYNFIIYLM